MHGLIPLPRKLSPRPWAGSGGSSGLAQTCPSYRGSLTAPCKVALQAPSQHGVLCGSRIALAELVLQVLPVPVPWKLVCCHVHTLNFLLCRAPGELCPGPCPEPFQQPPSLVKGPAAPSFWFMKLNYGLRIRAQTHCRGWGTLQPMASLSFGGSPFISSPASAAQPASCPSPVRGREVAQELPRASEMNRRNRKGRQKQKTRREGNNATRSAVPEVSQGLMVKDMLSVQVQLNWSLGGSPGRRATSEHQLCVGLLSSWGGGV